MAKTYLRVASDWTDILSPGREVDTFLLNASGISIQVVLSSIPWDKSTEAHAFTLGGPISQLKVEKDMYAYGRAMMTDTDLNFPLLITDTTRIYSADIVEMREDIDRISAEFLKFLNRVTDMELKSIRHRSDWMMLYREFKKSDQATRDSLANLYKNLMRTNIRLFEAEMWIFRHKQFHTTIDYLLADLEGIDGFSEKFNALKIDLGQVSNMVNALNNKLNEYIPRIEAAWGDYQDLVEEEITPLQQDLADLEKDFVDLNNALVVMGTKHTAEEIAEVFTTLIQTASSDMILPLQTLRDVLIELTQATATNEEQNTILDKVLMEDDTIILNGENWQDLAQV